MVHRLRIPLACVTALGLVLGLAPGVAAAQAPMAATSGTSTILPTTLNLPNGFQPRASRSARCRSRSSGPGPTAICSGST